MKKVQFFIKDRVVVHSNVCETTYDVEKTQLIEQGFELTGEVIESATVEEAYQEFRITHGDPAYKYPLLRILSEVPQALALKTIFGG